jgi:4-hydroxythreonine-4-phosphate dehydrogenase
VIFITLGDPWSVNVECLEKALGRSRAWERAPVVVAGSRWHWERQARGDQGLIAFQGIERLSDVTRWGLYFWDIPARKEWCVSPRELSEEARGAIAYAPLQRVPRAGEFPRLAVLTAPIDKHACAEAGFRWDGHTEFFEEHWGAKAIMLLAGPRLRVGLATNHVALAEVPRALTVEGVAGKIALMEKTLRETLGVTRPRIAVCGLNPHAGDGGLFGDEEARILRPAIARARGVSRSSEIEGPIPADTAFYRATRGTFDAVLAMYHDQGLAPLKLLHFDEAVNISGGLPHLRVSPDHGPAADLFGRGEASTRSFEMALELCERHVAGRSA